MEGMRQDTVRHGIGVMIYGYRTATGPGDLEAIELTMDT